MGFKKVEKKTDGYFIIIPNHNYLVVKRDLHQMLYTYLRVDSAYRFFVLNSI